MSKKTIKPDDFEDIGVQGRIEGKIIKFLPTESKSERDRGSYYGIILQEDYNTFPFKYKSKSGDINVVLLTAAFESGDTCAIDGIVKGLAKIYQTRNGKYPIGQTYIDVDYVKFSGISGEKKTLDQQLIYEEFV